MFTLTEERRVEWPVKVRVPEKGKTRIESFTGIFEVPDIETAIERIGDGKEFEKVREFLEEVFVGWRDVVDANGQAVPFSEEAKAAALSRHDVCEAVAEAFHEVLQGGRRKN